MTTDDLTAFITARLGEDEAALADDDNDQPGELRFAEMDERSGSYYWHFANNDRVRREVAAKRAIVNEAKAVQKLTDLTDGKPDRYRDWVLRHLAAVWSDHPDYKQEWAT